MFDDADVVLCYRGRESIVPQQALALANSKLALTISRRFTWRILQFAPRLFHGSGQGCMFSFQYLRTEKAGTKS